MMDFGKSLKLGKSQSLFSAPLSFDDNDDTSPHKQDSEEREDVEEEETLNEGVEEEEEDYGDEIVDLGDDVEPFSMQFKAPFKQELPNMDK